MVDFTSRGTQIAIGVLVMGLLTAFLLPAAISPIAEDRTATIQHTTGNTSEVTGTLEATVTNVDTTNNAITVELADKTSNNTATVSALNEGANQTVTLSGEEITVHNDKITSSNSATVTYTYPETFGWGGGATSLYYILPIFFVLAILLFVVNRVT